MPHTLEDPATLAIALAAEGGLAAAGAVVCWLLEIPLAEQLLPTHGPAATLALGAAATAPMIGLFFVLLWLRWRPLARLRRQVKQLVRELLGGAGYAVIAAVALSAGFGEELLFRGALQPAFAQVVGVWPGVAAAALLFGMVHPMSFAYFTIATLCGLYLGMVTELTGELLPAIIAHAAYDFVALVWLRRAG